MDMIGYPQCSFLLSTANLESEGMLYFYSTYNANPGGVTLIKVDPGDLTKSTVTEIFNAEGNQNYCISSIICDKDGNLYYKNDSGNVFCIKSVLPPINVYVTIADKGTLPVARESVSVKDLNKDGKFDIDEALFAAHEAYYDGGAAAGYSSYNTDYGLSIGMLWGDTSYNFGYYVDNNMAFGLEDELTEGQHLKAYITVNSYPNMDAYSYFENDEYNAYTSVPFIVSLYSQNGYDEYWNPTYALNGNVLLTATTEDTGEEYDGFAYVSMEDGSLKLRFNDPGTYYVTASDDDNSIVPSVCKVVVADKENIFTDMSGHWAEKFATLINAYGIMDGVGNNEFAPELKVSRAMLVTMLYALEGKPSNGDSVLFDDVDAGSWYAEPVRWAMENKIVSGIGDNKFAPDSPVTREQLVLILMKYAEYRGIDTSSRADLSEFGDKDDISPYAVNAVEWAVAEKFIGGYPDGTIMPQNSTTRAEAAVILLNFINTCMH